MTLNHARKLSICTVLLSFCSTSFAAESVLEEVTVTATKRGDQDIQSIPASIYALSGSILEEKAHFDFRAVATSIPGLTFQDLGPGDMEFIIRGVNGNGPAVVGSYFGEYVITASDQQDGGGKNAPIKLIDMQRVEVLKWPAGHALRRQLHGRQYSLHSEQGRYGLIRCFWRYRSFHDRLRRRRLHDFRRHQYAVYQGQPGRQSGRLPDR